MKNRTVNISFRSDLLKVIDRVAKEEARSRSELIREAARLYIDRKHRWASLFTAAETATRLSGATLADIPGEIAKVRRAKSKSTHKRR